METKAKLGWLTLGLLVAVGAGWWLTRPTDRMEFKVPQAHLDEAKKGKIDEHKYAGTAAEGGSRGNGTEHEMEDLAKLPPPPPAVPPQTDEMKAKGIGPVGDKATH